MADDAASDASFISEHYLKVHPELAHREVPIFQQEHHPQGFKRISMAPNVDVEEAYPNAFAAARGLNPDFFKMPFGSRVINIKTDFPENIFYSIEKGVWSTLEKVSERIMSVWNAREDPNEKVLFLFSVNGQKQFCGLAEMSAPWQPDAVIDSWQDSSSGAGNVGIFPIAWKFVKNVPYAKFAHIKQERNKQSISNMWSGMHMDSDAGRKVIEIFVTTPNFSNCLAWVQGKKNYLGPPGFNWQLTQQRNNGYNAAAHQDRQNAIATRGGQTVPQYGCASGDGNTSTALTTNNWRGNENNAQPFGQVAGKAHGKQPVPTGPRQPTTLALNTNVPVAHLDGSVETSAGPRPGDVVTCVMDVSGNLLPVTSSGGNKALANMPSREFYPRGNNRGGYRGGYQGGPRGPGRWNGNPRAGRYNNFNINNNNNRGVYLQGQRSQVGLGIRSGNNSRQDLHNNHSVATLRSLAEREIAATSASTTIPPHAIAARPFVPQSQANRALQHAATCEDFSPSRQQGKALRSEASSASFQTQIMPHTDPTTSTSTFANPTFLQQLTKRLPELSHVSTIPSDSTCPSLFRSVDSMAGVPRPVSQKQQAARLQQAVAKPPMPRNLEARSPTPDPLQKDADLTQKTSDWVKQTPTLPNFAPSVVDGATVPLGKRATYYHLMADKAAIAEKIAGMSFEVDAADYYRTLAKQAEIENMISRLTKRGRGSSDGSQGTDCTSSSSEMGPTNYATSSQEDRDISPVRTEGGRALYSASRRGSPPPRRGHRARHAPKSDSTDARMQADVDRLVNSPPPSVKPA